MEQELRNRVRDAVREYYNEVFAKPREFKYIPASGKLLGCEELEAMVDASLDMWLTAGRFNDEFEKEFAKYLGVKFALSTNSGSSANLLALSALTSYKLGERRLKKGDEVISVAAGFPTTINPIIQQGLIPVFIDCEIGTYNIDAEKIEEAITDKTKAVFLAHTLGNSYDLDKIKQICDKYNLWLIEDSCDALGGEYRGKKLGTIGHIGTYSFYPAHHMTMGEGGAVVTNLTVENTADNTEWNVLYLYDEETANSQSYVFEDDKTTTNTLQNGQYMLTWFEASNAEDETTIAISHEGTMYDGMEAVRTITFEIPGTDGKFASVSKLIDGVQSDMEKCNDKSAFDAAGDNVWFVDENSTIWVKTSYNYQNGTVQQIILSSTPTAIDETANASRFDFACIGQPVGTKADFLFTVDKEYFSSSIRIIDMAGSSVDTVDGGNVNAGTNIVTYENPGLVSGVYVAVLSLEDNGAVDTANCKFVVK